MTRELIDSSVIPFKPENRGIALKPSIILGASVSLMLVGFIAGTNYPISEQATPTPTISSNVSTGKLLKVKTTQLKPVKSYQVQRTYTGEVAAMRGSELSFERSGKVVRLLVDEGDRISSQTPIAQLDTSNLATKKLELIAQKAEAEAVLEELKRGPRIEKINAARATIKNLEQQLALLEAKRTRREYLYQEGAISQEQLDEFAYNSRALSAQLEEAQSRLDELLTGTRSEKIKAQQAVVQQLEAAIADININLAKSTIKAPFSGTVAKRHLDEGSVIAAGESVVRLVENGKPEVRVGIPVVMGAQLKIGSQQTVTIGKSKYQAKVTSILPEVERATRTQTVVLTLEEAAAYQVAPGAIARLNVTQNILTSGFWLPTTALIKGERGLWSCYVLVESVKSPENMGVIEARDVEVLHTQGDRVLVRGTLQPGEKAIVNGTHRIVPGQSVKVF